MGLFSRQLSAGIFIGVMTGLVARESIADQDSKIKPLLKAGVKGTAAASRRVKQLYRTASHSLSKRTTPTEKIADAPQKASKTLVSKIKLKPAITKKRLSKSSH
jgi:hypothetical protein